MTVEEFFARFNGQGIDFDHAYGYQCMDLAEEYNRDVVGAPRLGGNAIDVWTNFPANWYTQIINTPENFPNEGDLILWNTNVGNGYGHIAVCQTANASSLTSFDQNWPLGSLCHFQWHNYGNVLGWLRPNRPVYSKRILEVRPSMTCLDVVAVTGKHLLFVGVESRTWSHQQFINVAKFARAHDVDSLLIKFAEGTIVWYGGIDGFRSIRDVIKEQGVGVVPYMYCYGDRFGGLDGELNLLAQYMQDNGVVCADMEVEWNGHVDWALRMQTRLQDVPGVFLVSTWGDPFLQDWGSVIRALNPCVDAYMPQQYTNYLASCWQQFAQSGARCLQPTIDLSQEFGPNDPIAIAKAAYNQGHTALSVWHYGSAVENPGLLDAVFHAFPKGDTAMPQPPANPYEVNANIRQELDSCWNSTAQILGGTPAPMNTGIHDSWVKAWLFHNYQFGPPITQEYSSIDSDGNPITVQECAHARCEWDKYGIPHWYTATGPVRF